MKQAKKICKVVYIPYCPISFFWNLENVRNSLLFLENNNIDPKLYFCLKKELEQRQQRQNQLNENNNVPTVPNVPNVPNCDENLSSSIFSSDSDVTIDAVEVKEKEVKEIIIKKEDDDDSLKIINFNIFDYSKILPDSDNDIDNLSTKNTAHANGKIKLIQKRKRNSNRKSPPNKRKKERSRSREH